MAIEPVVYGASERVPRGDYSRAAANYTCPQNHAAYTAADHDTYRRLYERQSALLPGLATLAVIWRFVRDPPRRTPAATATAVPATLSRPQTALLGCVAVWALGAASEQFLLLRAAHVGVPQAFIPLVWFGMSLAKSGAAGRAGRLADAVSPRLALVAGWLVFAAAYAGLAVTASLPAVLALVGVVGLAYGIAEPAERALVAALAADGRQGGAFGWYALVQGLMALPAGLLAGWLWESGSHGPAWSFAVTAGLSLAACGLLVAGSRRGG